MVFFYVAACYVVVSLGLEFVNMMFLVVYLCGGSLLYCSLLAVSCALLPQSVYTLLYSKACCFPPRRQHSHRLVCIQADIGLWSTRERAIEC